MLINNDVQCGTVDLINNNKKIFLFKLAKVFFLINIIWAKQKIVKKIKSIKTFFL